VPGGSKNLLTITDGLNAGQARTLWQAVPMIDGPLLVLTVIAAVGSGLVAGAFFVFSVMVMPGLARLQAAPGAAAMQAFNIVAIRPLFMTALFAPALVCLALLVASIINWGEAGSGYVLVASASYLVGAIVTTGAYNVPRNNALAALDPDDDQTQKYWAQYMREWTRANHVRAATSLAAAALFTVALLM
jgi:uncharacterized membrane protein